MSASYRPLGRGNVETRGLRRARSLRTSFMLRAIVSLDIFRPISRINRGDKPDEWTIYRMFVEVP